MSDLQQMADITQALYRAEQAKLQGLLKREGDLRRALADLDERRRTAANLPADELDSVRAIGADLAWQGWVQRSRSALNMELAQVLVKKAQRMGRLRHAFGRAEAVAQLGRDEKTARHKSVQDREARAVVELIVLKGR
ncbi:hypothetical protein OO012_10535 [Rhodobacteraceae bacterium KMM 6894]|nr:hypothetical protein [Rhodobacteraceae bacterium KMM 6894]